MEHLLRQELETSVLRRTEHKVTGGQISEGSVYQTDQGLVFVKNNSHPSARLMFEGECASLRALSAAGEVRVPQPIKVISNPDGGAAFVMEYFDLSSLSSRSAQLGEQIANLHKKNADIGKYVKKSTSSVHRNKDLIYVNKFGFDLVTYCGYIPQCNEWTDSWEQYFVRKLNEQVDLLETEKGDNRVRPLWTQLLRNVSRFFDDLHIEPALLHGDLNENNIGQLRNEPVVFDPACFYGHSEFDLSISLLFGGIDEAFYERYFQVIPKQHGFHRRQQLYNLYHNINHWNHFGGHYVDDTIQLFKSLGE